jgi:hypothetical protein
MCWSLGAAKTKVLKVARSHLVQKRVKKMQVADTNTQKVVHNKGTSAVTVNT